jgi:hypothetical protein
MSPSVTGHPVGVSRRGTTAYAASALPAVPN